MRIICISMARTANFQHSFVFVFACNTIFQLIPQINLNELWKIGFEWVLSNEKNISLVTFLTRFWCLRINFIAIFFQFVLSSMNNLWMVTPSWYFFARNWSFFYGCLKQKFDACLNEFFKVRLSGFMHTSASPSASTSAYVLFQLKLRVFG